MTVGRPRQMIEDDARVFEREHAANAREIFRVTYPILVATASRLVSSSSEAEDLVQDTYVETLSWHPDFRGLHNPVGYLKTVMFRTASHRWRRSDWKREVPTDLQDVLDMPAGADVHGRLLAEDEVRALPRKQRACVLLRYAYELDDDAIAEIVGCRPSTVRSQISRGLKSLAERKTLDEEA